MTKCPNCNHESNYAPPDGMALVPIEPTKEMILAAEEAYTPFGDMGMALLCGNLAAAPKENSND